MHGMLITFTTAIPLADLDGPFTDYATSLRQVDGLVSKAWLQESETVVGGFHLFTDAASADAYLESSMVAQLQATEGFSHFVVRRFEIIDHLSAMTGVAPTTVV